MSLNLDSEVPVNRLKVASDIIALGAFKTHAAEHLRNLHKTRRPLILTQNGKPAAVVLTPAEFDDWA